MADFLLGPAGLRGGKASLYRQTAGGVAGGFAGHRGSGARSKVPWFCRFGTAFHLLIAGSRATSKIGESPGVTPGACSSWNRPAPGLYWYGIHGCGCSTPSWAPAVRHPRTHAEGTGLRYRRLEGWPSAFRGTRLSTTWLWRGRVLTPRGNADVMSSKATSRFFVKSRFFLQDRKATRYRGGDDPGGSFMEAADEANGKAGIPVTLRQCWPNQGTGQCQSQKETEISRDDGLPASSPIAAKRGTRYLLTSSCLSGVPLRLRWMILTFQYVV